MKKLQIVCVWSMLLWLLSPIYCQNPTLPKTLNTNLAGYPTSNFELKADNYLYKIEAGTPRKVGSNPPTLTDITYDLKEFPMIQCTKQDGGGIIAFDLTSEQFKETLQDITVNGTGYQLKANRDVLLKTSGVKVGANAGVLRNENGHLLMVNKTDGAFKRYLGTPNSWEDINQIVTLGGVSYIVKADKTLWILYPDLQQGEKIADQCELILSDEKDTGTELTILSVDGKYRRINRANKTWSVFTPTMISASPSAIDPGIWFVIQNKASLDETNLGLKVNQEGEVVLSAIPQTGEFDEFLWTTEKLNDGRYRLLNKQTGLYKSLDLNQGTPVLLSKNNDPTRLWNFSVANSGVHGLNAYTISNTSNSSVLSNQSNQLKALPGNSSAHQVWVIQPMDLKRGVKLPDNLGSADERKSYDKILKIPDGPTVYGSKYVSDWSVLNAYNIVQNMINALSDQAAVASSQLSNHKIVVIGKDDAFPAVADYSIITGNQVIAFYRGLNAGTSYTVVSEEMMCMNGVVNRFADFGERRFDHIVHEFGHGLDSHLGWNGQNTIPTSAVMQGGAPTFNSQKQELVAVGVQAWFDCNYPGSYGWYPKTRSDLNSRDRGVYDYFALKFSSTNTWKPPYRLRLFPAPTAQTYEVGDEAFDGIIFQIFKPGERGYVLGETHGLVCSKEDLGKYTIAEMFDECKAYQGGGWRPPSISQLSLMYENLHLKGIGDFSPEIYRTGSQATAFYWWVLHFGTNKKSGDGMNNKTLTRAVKTF